MRLMISLPLAAFGLALAACGPTQEAIEQSIVENYEERGATDITVSLDPDDDGGYTGYVEFEDAGLGTTIRHDCTVSAAEASEARWQCAPGAESMENAIADYYRENGAINPSVDLTASGADNFTGAITFTDPQSGQSLRQNCTVDTSGGNINWNCGPDV